MWIILGTIALFLAFLQLFTLQVIEQFFFISELLYLYPMFSAIFGVFCFVLLYILRGKGS